MTDVLAKQKNVSQNRASQTEAGEEDFFRTPIFLAGFSGYCWKKSGDHQLRLVVEIPLFTWL